jgi:hypothetical protein
LGNLTLTGYNTELSNSAFEIKKVELAKSHLDINSYFNALPKWNAETIRARTTVLAERLVTLWPRPATEVNYAASAEAMPEPEGLTNAAKQRLEYWRQMDVRLEDRGVPRNFIVAAPDSSITTGIGDSGSVEFEFGFNQQRGRIFLSLNLSDEIGACIASHLAEAKTAIEQELGYSLDWEIRNQGGEIFISDEGIQIRDENDWPVQHDWFGDRLEDFQRVLQPRVIALEKEALNDPELRQSFEQRELLVKYWRACSAALTGSQLSFRENEPGAGKTVCRFKPLDDGVNFGIQYYPSISILCVYLGVLSSAARKQRQLFKELVESHIPELETQIGEKLHWEDPYFWVSITADIGATSDWPRQHQWVKETAEKFIATFKPRLAIV